MPVKRRTAKRRQDPQAEMLAWSGLFRCGYDYFNDLEPYGYRHPTDATARADAPEAWKRLGGAFMDWWNEGRRGSLPHATGDNGEPWALIEFGEPPRAR